MQIKQDPVTGLYCREDGAVLMPPSGIRYRTFRWTFGSRQRTGYLMVQYEGKHYLAHRLICRAFHGLPPEGKPQADHINRVRNDNRPSNLRWVSPKENSDNAGSVDKSVETYGVRACEDKRAYTRAYYKTHRKSYKAYDAAYRGAHREEINAHQRARWASKRAEMRSKGFTFRKGPYGKWGWFPRIRT